MIMVKESLLMEKLFENLFFFYYACYAFSYAGGATVKNLSFDNLFITGGNGSGGAVAGYANWGGLSASSYPWPASNIRLYTSS